MDGMAGVRGRRWVRWVALLAPAVVIVLVGGGLDHPTVVTRKDLADVAFGKPWPWLLQDQTSQDPPLPYRTAFLSPLEDPTTVTWWALGADVIVVGVVLAALVRLGAGLLRRSGRGGVTA